jgi:hypothetical protein
MKKLAPLFVLALVFVQSAYGQSDKGTRPIAIPIVTENKPDTVKRTVSNGHYSWKATGDRKIDGENIEAASQKFKKDQPAQYAKVACDPPKIIIIPDSDFVSMTKEKQEWILANPKNFKLIKKEKINTK